MLTNSVNAVVSSDMTAGKRRELSNNKTTRICLLTQLFPAQAFFSGHIFQQIKDTVCLDSKIKSERQADINITLNAMLDVVSMQNFRIFNALLISLNNLLNNIKSVRFYFLELQNKVADFYLK